MSTVAATRGVVVHRPAWLERLRHQPVWLGVLGVPTAVTQMFDPSTRVWSAEISMYTARIGFSATVLQDGRVLVVGGIDPTMSDLKSAGR